MKLSERDFLNWILDVAARGRWRAWHVGMPVRPVGGGKFVPDPRGAGLPDLVLLHKDPPRMLFAEVKGTGGKLTTEQQEFLGLAREVARVALDPEAGCSERCRVLGVYVWTPGDEATIETILLSKKMLAS